MSASTPTATRSTFRGCIVKKLLHEHTYDPATVLTPEAWAGLTETQRLEVTFDEQRDLEKLLKNVVLTVEHDPERTPCGQVTHSCVEGDSWFVDVTTADTALGRLNNEFINLNLLTGLSLHHCVVDRIPLELSLCRQGARSGTGIDLKLDSKPSSYIQPSAAIFHTAKEGSIVIAASAFSFQANNMSNHSGTRIRSGAAETKQKVYHVTEPTMKFPTQQQAYTQQRRQLQPAATVRRTPQQQQQAPRKVALAKAVQQLRPAPARQTLQPTKRSTTAAAAVAPPRSRPVQMATQRAAPPRPRTSAPVAAPPVRRAAPAPVPASFHEVIDQDDDSDGYAPPDAYATEDGEEPEDGGEVEQEEPTEEPVDEYEDTPEAPEYEEEEPEEPVADWQEEEPATEEEEQEVDEPTPPARRSIQSTLSNDGVNGLHNIVRHMATTPIATSKDRTKLVNSTRKVVEHNSKQTQEVQRLKAQLAGVYKENKELLNQSRNVMEKLLAEKDKSASFSATVAASKRSSSSPEEEDDEGEALDAPGPALKQLLSAVKVSNNGAPGATGGVKFKPKVAASKTRSRSGVSSFDLGIADNTKVTPENRDYLQRNGAWLTKDMLPGTREILNAPLRVGMDRDKWSRDRHIPDGEYHISTGKRQRN